MLSTCFMVKLLIRFKKIDYRVRRDLMSTSKLFRGTAILTAGTMFSRLLGLVYIFPFYAMVGEKGGELYSYAYILYTLMLSAATMGLPLAVSKFVAKYNSLGEYGVGRKLFRSGLFTMSITGVIAFLILYTLAPYTAPIILGREASDYIHSVEDVTHVIRMVSFALLLVPIMSLIRGFFQGHESMGPTALSQVVEQLARILFILGSVYFVIRVMDGDLSTAIGFATFAAFIGALGSLLILVWYWFKRKRHLDKLLEQDKGNVEVSYKDMYKELILYAGPFVFAGLTLPLFQSVDLFTFNSAMGSGGHGNTNAAFGIINTYAHKLVIIPVTLATSFALTLLPTITKSFVSGNNELLQKQISKVLQVLLFLTLPACIGLALLGGPAYTAFFSYDELGGYLLTWYAPVAILLALFTVSAAILQGINEQRHTIYAILLGLAVKFITNYVFIIQLGAIGSIIATALGYIVTVGYILYIIQKKTGFNYSFVMRRSLLIVIFLAAMAIVVIPVKTGLDMILPYSAGTLNSSIIIVISAVVGAFVYFFLSFRSKLIYYIFGENLPFMGKLKRFKRSH